MIIFNLILKFLIEISILKFFSKNNFNLNFQNIYNFINYTENHKNYKNSRISLEIKLPYLLKTPVFSKK